MKLTVLFVACLFIAGSPDAQIITPVVRANFGVDADLKANFFNGALSPGNDDWFSDGAAGSGVFIIDTTGATAIKNQYLLDPEFRKTSFIRGMQYPMYSTINGKLLYDAVYIRDHYKNDSTSFTSSNKNGQSPVDWVGSVTPVPGKSDINDMMVHVRRDGPALTDSLWFFAGLSLLGNTGNRYFDFELYQSDVYYNKSDNKFYNYGAQAGHTAWTFDALGNVTSPGDVIFTAEFGSSSLTLLEARVWIHKSSLSLIPAQFSWNGTFDGDGSSAQYGYAGIVPKTGGIFYGGNQCTNNTWAGPFGFVDVTDVYSTNYAERDYMEIAVNMTKIGLDPYNILGVSCNLSFKKVFAKTRSSTSFTSDLKDFVGPYAIATPPAAVAAGNLSLFCGPGPGFMQLSVNNPLSTSTYTWTTTNGNITTSPAVGESISADQPGTYIVTQTLHSSCAPYATDTITIIKDTHRCMVLAGEDIRFAGRINQQDVLLSWASSGKDISHFDVQRSADGKSFETIAISNAVKNSETDHNYIITDPAAFLNSKFIYYRLKITATNSQVSYSNVIALKNANALTGGLHISPNPASDFLQVSFTGNSKAGTWVNIYNMTGMKVQGFYLKNANNKLDLRALSPGMYFVQADSGDGKFKALEKLLIQ